MTRASQLLIPPRQTLPPPAWSLIPRSRTRRSGPRQGTPLTAHPVYPHRSQRDSSFTSPNPQGSPDTTGNSAISVLRNLKLARTPSHFSPLIQVFCISLQNRLHKSHAYSPLT